MSGNRPGSLKVVTSMATICFIKWDSKALVFCSLVAKAEIVLCFLSGVNVDGRFPCFCKKSGMWSSQCHFFIKGTPKSASWKLWMAFSAAASKLALVVAPGPKAWPGPGRPGMPLGSWLLESQPCGCNAA